jgi:hypothetical protein
VRPVPIPTHVGDLRWPVQAAVRVQPEPEGGPVEFVVVVDCREFTPTRRYAVLTVYMWPDRVVAQQGTYDLTFTRAQHIMLERARLLPTTRVEVITVRDPDRANEYTVFIDGQRRDIAVTDTGLYDTGTPDASTAGAGDTGVAGRVRVLVCDIDPGDIGVTAAWVRDMLTRADRLSPAAAAWAGDVVADYAEDNATLLP